MNSASTPVQRQPVESRPMIYDTEVGRVTFSRRCIVLLTAIGFVVFFTGIIMAAAGTDNVVKFCVGTNCYIDHEQSGTRKAGIVFIVFGGIPFVAGIALAFKSYNENQVLRGNVYPQPQSQGGSYQGGVANPQAQTSYDCGFDQDYPTKPAV